MEHWTKKLFRKITPKHVQNTLGHFREQFGHLWNFDFFLIFWNHFEDSTLHGTLGKKHFRKNYTKTCSKHVGQFGNDFGRFWNLKNILKTFRRLDPPWNTGQKSFSEKITPKHVRNTFGQFGNNFGRFWIFENFLKTFRWLDTPWNTWQKFFRKNYPKTCSKHVWTLLGTILGIFGILKISRFFENISKTRPSMEHWAKNIFEKITPKHVQNTLDNLGTILGVFGILKIF